MMFGKNKQKLEDKIILNIDQVLQDPNIKQEERDALTRAKNRLEKGQYIQRVLNDFLAQVRDLALQSKLTPSVAKLYSGIINDAYKGSGWSGMMFL